MDKLIIVISTPNRAGINTHAGVVFGSSTEIYQNLSNKKTSKSIYTQRCRPDKTIVEEGQKIN
jgi:hypothetical protein